MLLAVGHCKVAYVEYSAHTLGQSWSTAQGVQSVGCCSFPSLQHSHLLNCLYKSVPLWMNPFHFGNFDYVGMYFQSSVSEEVVVAEGKRKAGSTLTRSVVGASSAFVEPLKDAPDVLMRQ